ncbi:hypothetical protein CEXT_325871 [Caerostris extrusa]|uniref:Uncharacterized protein n=1 Tax=Caerostris extrusa TaxID=172846 RepID=A0AAV4SBS3_CAEEX|nr:hypothetical protein CEXT_325871 [Caerostris extrusa]
MVPRSALKNKEVGLKEEICPLHPAIDPPFHSHLSSATPTSPASDIGVGRNCNRPPLPSLPFTLPIHIDLLHFEGCGWERGLSSSPNNFSI